MRWQILVLRDSGAKEWVEVSAASLGDAVDSIINAPGVVRAVEAFAATDGREPQDPPRVLGECVSVRPEGDAFVSSDGARRWEVIGDPIEDWFVEVDADGNKLSGGWEWYREEGFAVMMSCS